MNERGFYSIEHTHRTQAGVPGRFGCVPRLKDQNGTAACGHWAFTRCIRATVGRNVSYQASADTMMPRVRLNILSIFAYALTVWAQVIVGPYGIKAGGLMFRDQNVTRSNRLPGALFRDGTLLHLLRRVGFALAAAADGQSVAVQVFGYAGL